MRTRLLLPAVLLVALGAACGDPDSTAQAGRSSEGPQGREFLSTGVTEKGEDRPLVAGTRIRLSFTDDYRLIASAGCNTMSGQGEIRDGRLIVGDLATTEMGCDPDRHAQDEWLARFLLEQPFFHLQSPEMTLSDDDIEIRFTDREVADPDRPLEGTRWVVDTVIDGQAASSVPEGADAHLIFNPDDGFGGSTGCNQMGGAATVDEDAGTITFGDVVTTKMACEDDRMALERSVLSVLDGEVTYTIKADRLTIEHPSGKGLGLSAAQ